MVLAVVITKSKENRGVWQILSESLLHLSVGIHQFVICFNVIITRVLSYTVPDQVTI